MSSLRITKTLSLDTLRVNKFLAFTASNTEVPEDYAFISNGNGVAEWRDLKEYVKQVPQDQINDISGRLDAIAESIVDAATSGTIAGTLNVNTNDSVTVFGVADSSGRTMYSYKNNIITPCINPIIGTVYTVRYDCGIFVAVGADDNNKCIKWSRDGITWIDAVEHPFNDICVPQNIACDGKGMWIAVGFDPDGTAVMAYSDLSAQRWTSIETPIGFEFANSIAWNGLMWVAGGGNIDTVNQQSFIYSYNGIEWLTDITGGFSGMAMDLVWNGKLWVAVGYDETNLYDTIRYSRDGKNWISVEGTIQSKFRRIGYSVDWNGREFLATGSDIGGTKTIAFSLDGITWSLVENGPQDIVKHCYWDGMRWFGIGLENVYVSENIQQWSVEISGFPDSSIPGMFAEITSIGGHPQKTLLTVNEDTHKCGINNQFPTNTLDVNGSLHITGPTYITSHYIDEDTKYNNGDSLLVGTDTFVIDITSESYEDISSIIHIPLSSRVIVILNAYDKKIYLPQIDSVIPYSFIIHNRTQSTVTLYDPRGLQTIYSRTDISSTYTIGSNNIVQMCGVRNFKNGDGQINEQLPYIYYRFSGLEGVDLSGYNIQQQLNDIIEDISNTNIKIGEIMNSFTEAVNMNILTVSGVQGEEISCKQFQVDSTAVISNCVFQNAVMTADSLQLRNTYNRLGVKALQSTAITIKTDNTLVIDRTYLYDVSNGIRMTGVYNKVIVSAVNPSTHLTAFIELPDPLTENIMVDEITILNIDDFENTVVVRSKNNLPVIIVESSNKNNRRVTSKAIEPFESYTFRLVRNYKGDEPVITPNPYYWICK
jgi:hypothetical protein